MILGVCGATGCVLLSWHLVMPMSKADREAQHLAEAFFFLFVLNGNSGWFLWFLWFSRVF